MKSKFLTCLLLFAAGLSSRSLPVCLNQVDSLEVERNINIQEYSKAYLLVTNLLEKMEREGREAEAFYLWLRAQRAYTLDRQSQNNEAMREALEVADLAKESGFYSVEGDALLTIALLHEEFGDGERCGKILEQIGCLLEGREMPAIRSRFHVRSSSYESIFGDRDSVAVHAEKAIIYGKKANYSQGILNGHFMLLRANYDRDEATVYLNIEAMMKECRRSENHAGLKRSMFNLSSELWGYGKKKKAIALNDSLVDLVNGMNEIDPEENYMVVATFRSRAKMLSEEGDYKGAYQALQMKTEVELEHMKTTSKQHISEVEANYKLEKKDKELQMQANQLYVERLHARRMWIALFLSGLFVALLLYQGIRLRRLKNELQKNAVLLEESNVELAGAVRQEVTLRGEINHRVKNSLQIIISLLNLQERRSGDAVIKKSLRATSERVYSIAAIHELLYPLQAGSDLNAKDYITMLCNHSAAMWSTENQPVFKLEVTNKVFDLDVIVPLGMMISEMLTNSRKYFGPPDGRPEINISLTGEGSLYCLEYRDNGLGFPNGKLEGREGGLGKYLFEGMSRQLNGWFESENDGGAVVRIYFELENNFSAEAAASAASN